MGRPAEPDEPGDPAVDEMSVEQDQRREREQRGVVVDRVRPEEHEAGGGDRHAFAERDRTPPPEPRKPAGDGCGDE